MTTAAKPKRSLAHANVSAPAAHAVSSTSSISWTVAWPNAQPMHIPIITRSSRVDVFSAPRRAHTRQSTAAIATSRRLPETKRSPELDSGGHGIACSSSAVHCSSTIWSSTSSSGDLEAGQQYGVGRSRKMWTKTRSYHCCDRMYVTTSSANARATGRRCFAAVAPRVSCASESEVRVPARRSDGLTMGWSSGETISAMDSGRGRSEASPRSDGVGVSMCLLARRPECQ